MPIAGAFASPASAPRTRAIAICATASVIVHAALVFAWAGQTLRDSGAVRTTNVAVSLELTATEFFDQAVKSEAAALAAAESVVSEAAGADEDRRSTAEASEPAAIPTQDPMREEETPPHETPVEALAPPMADAAAQAELPAASQPPVERKPEPVREQPRRRVEVAEKTRNSAKDVQDQAAQKKGGARSSGQAAKVGAAGRVSASGGDISGYTSRVRARVAANRPAARGSARGTAMVSFGISSSGGLSFVRISRSSGNAGLDQLAVGAVRRSAPFPPPPAAIAGRTTITMPFYFR